MELYWERTTCYELESTQVEHSLLGTHGQAGKL